jgi:hypothetical protein
VPAVEWETERRPVVVERDERVHVHDDARAMSDRDVERRDLGHGAVDHLPLADANRLEENRDGRRGGYGAADQCA